MKNLCYNIIMRNYEKSYIHMKINYSFEELIYEDSFLDNKKIIHEIIIKSIKTFLNKILINKIINSKELESYLIRNENNCICMEYNSKIIGILVLIENEINLIIVDRKYQSKKHLFYLLKYAENMLFWKYKEIKLLSFKENNKYNRFFEQNGWKKIEEIYKNEIMYNRYIKILDIKKATSPNKR